VPAVHAVVPVEGTRLFADRLRSISTNRVVYAEIPIVDAIESFAAWVRSREKTHQA
jgi:hypothetical protein